MLFRFAALSLAGVAAAVPVARPGLKIVSREVRPALVIETTEYIQTDRGRVESRAVPVRTAGGEPQESDGQVHRISRITRCDLDRAIVLDYDHITYMTYPLRTHPSRAQMLVASIASRRAKPKPPTLLIETATVQTGERRTAFGYAARRVITTRRQIPLDGSGDATSEIRTDGWYVDLEMPRSCDQAGVYAVHTVLLGRSGSPGARFDPPVVSFKDIGAQERGFPIELTTTWRTTGAAAIASGNAAVSHTAVTQLSREVLNPALFEVPAGFRSAEGRLAAYAAHWIHVWQTVKALAAAFVQ
jgi:hypothetical protein